MRVGREGWKDVSLVPLQMLLLLMSAFFLSKVFLSMPLQLPKERPLPSLIKGEWWGGEMLPRNLLLLMLPLSLLLSLLLTLPLPNGQPLPSLV